MLEIYAKAVVTVAVIVVVVVAVAVIVVVVIVALQTFCRCVESAIIFCKVCDSSASMNKEENVISQFFYIFLQIIFLRKQIRWLRVSENFEKDLIVGSDTDGQINSSLGCGTAAEHAPCDHELWV